MERAIRRRLLTSELSELLAQFKEEPSIFYQRSPDDVDWQEGYPQMILTVEKYSDAQKGVSGQLKVDIITSQDKLTPEPLEKITRQNLEGVFLRGEEIFSLKWRQSEVFSEPASERLPLIYGATMTFDIYEYPTAQTLNPDPIEALNLWASRFDENIMVIGCTRFDEAFKPTRKCPAIYFDVAKVKLSQQKTAAIFMDATINLHLFAPTLADRRLWLMALYDDLNLLGALWLSDDSPSRITDSQYDWSRTEVEGQIQLQVSYGILRQHWAHTLERARWRDF